LKKIRLKEKFETEFEDEEKFNEDDFKIGMRFSYKNIKLFTNFKYSDIIVASPLALKFLFSNDTK
jgi:hypothetical protein